MRLFEEVNDEKVFYKGLSDLDSLATNFVKRSYLENLSTLPRMQEIPDEAFTMRPGSPVFVSHAWLAANQPDDTTLDAIRAFVPNDADLGLWIDFCCLPQKRRDGIDDRTNTEKRFFKSQLSYIPTVLLKSQLVVLWDTRHLRRGWCLVELILADIFINVVNKQVYHCRNKLLDPLLLITQTYNPVQFNVVRGVEGRPMVKILMPHAVMTAPTRFYNSVQNQLGTAPMLLTALLARVEPAHIDRFFMQERLECSNPSDITALKKLLLAVCRFAGGYDVTTINWTGKQSMADLWPYMMANTSDFSVNLVDYRF